MGGAPVHATLRAAIALTEAEQKESSIPTTRLVEEKWGYP